MKASEVAVRLSFLEQAELCERFGSPFTARLIRTLHDVLDRTTLTGRAILDWSGPPGATGDALALRIAGALHGLARSNWANEVTALYPPNAGIADAAFRNGLACALEKYDASLLPWLACAPQTNEVGRSVALFTGILEVSKYTSLPLALHEIGSSAGLNLILDRYRYDINGEIFGDERSPLTLKPGWTGPQPRNVILRIGSRRGCDVSPIHLTDPQARERLKAYVWPDQYERHERLSAAIDILLKDPPQIDESDALAWVRNVVGENRPRGQAVILMHSLTFSYLSDAAKGALREHMQTVGRSATPDRPVAWVAYELGEDRVTRLTLQMWPEGAEYVLARGHPHCTQMTWVAS